MARGEINMDRAHDVPDVDRQHILQRSHQEGAEEYGQRNGQGMRQRALDFRAQQNCQQRTPRHIQQHGKDGRGQDIEQCASDVGLETSPQATRQHGLTRIGAVSQQRTQQRTQQPLQLRSLPTFPPQQPNSERPHPLGRQVLPYTGQQAVQLEKHRPTRHFSHRTVQQDLAKPTQQRGQTVPNKKERETRTLEASPTPAPTKRGRGRPRKSESTQILEEQNPAAERTPPPQRTPEVGDRTPVQSDIQIAKSYRRRMSRHLGLDP